MRSRSSRAPAPRAAFVVFGAFRAKQLDWRETWRIRHPLTNDATNAAPCCASRRHPRGLARARAQCGVRHAQPSRGGERWRSAELAGAHKSPRSGPETGFPGPWHPQSPSHGVTNPNLAGLAPTNPLGWGRESEFPAGWRPQIASGGDANPRFAPVGAHKSPRVGMRIRVSRRLAPTNPLRWGRESSFPAGWRPQTPRTGAHAAQVDESGVRGTGARRAARRVDAPFVLVVASNGEKRIPERRVGQRRLAGCSE